MGRKKRKKGSTNDSNSKKSKSNEGVDGVNEGTLDIKQNGLAQKNIDKKRQLLLRIFSNIFEQIGDEKNAVNDDVLDVETYCYKDCQGDDSAGMLECGYCNQWYHFSCLNFKSTTVPTVWYCSQCVSEFDTKQPPGNMTLRDSLDTITLGGVNGLQHYQRVMLLAITGLDVTGDKQTDSKSLSNWIRTRKLQTKQLKAKAIEARKADRVAERLAKRQEKENKEAKRTEKKHQASNDPATQTRMKRCNNILANIDKGRTELFSHVLSKVSGVIPRDQPQFIDMVPKLCESRELYEVVDALFLQ